MSRLHLIGIAGPAGSGKSAAAEYISNAYGHELSAFANPLKAGLAAMLGMGLPEFEVRYMHQPNKEQVIQALGASPRKLMQTLGTEWGRKTINKDLWVLMAKRHVAWIEDNIPHEYPGVIFSDVRFENESAWIREFGGLVIHIHRPVPPTATPHESEVGVCVMRNDTYIINDGTLDELHRQLDACVQNHIEKAAA